MSKHRVTHVDKLSFGQFDTTTKTITISRGSILTTDLSHNPPTNIAQNYASLKSFVEKGSIKPLTDGRLEVIRDVPNLSPSKAKVFADGKPGSGWNAWLLNDGQLLDTLRQGDNCSPKRSPLPTDLMNQVMLDENDLKRQMESIRTEFLNDAYSRWLSWNHCYRFFRQPHPLSVEQKSEAALHLGFFLANWGMFRNSELLYKNHLFYKPLVDIVTAQKVRRLHDFLANEMSDEDAYDLMTPVAEEITSHLEKFDVSPTTTLLTKIFLATLGCVPAIDQQARKALGDLGLPLADQFGWPEKTSLTGIFAFARRNLDALREGARVISPDTTDEYPPMKILDMYLWRIGAKDTGEA